MKLNSYVLIATLILATAACNKKKSSEEEERAAAEAAKPTPFHKTEECPDFRGVWQYDISIPAGPGTVTAMKVEFGLDADGALTFNRLSHEKEEWKIDGMTVKTKEGSSVTAYCEAQTITVEILKTDNVYEALTFASGDPGGSAAQIAHLNLRTDKTKGRLDHKTQSIVLGFKDPKVFVRSTPADGGHE